METINQWEQGLQILHVAEVDAFRCPSPLVTTRWVAVADASVLLV